MTEWAGKWQLCAWSGLWSNEFEQRVEDFLYQAPAWPFGEVDDGGESHGSLLTIFENGTFTQQGKVSPPVLSYDEQGCQVTGVAEFNGVICVDGVRGFLILHIIPAFAEPKDRTAKQRLRWDDGDTKVCDSIMLMNEQLIRMMCVVTDESYGDRVVLVYQR